MKTRSGHLFQKTKGGTWYIRTVVNGERIVKSTRTCDRRVAEAARARFMSPYIAGDDAKVMGRVRRPSGAGARRRQGAAEPAARDRPRLVTVRTSFFL
jgi:hypothetical protein